MALSHLWHKLHLHRYQITGALLLFLLLMGGRVEAQQKISGENLPGYESRKLRWGFSLGLNTSWYQMEHSTSYVERIQDPSQAYSANVRNGIGFNVNFISTYRLASNFLVRFQPGVGYHSRLIDYKGNLSPTSTEPKVVQQINTFSAEVPLLVKYESLRRGNTQMYFVGGIKPSIVVGGQKNGNPDILQVGDSDFSIEYGVGLDLFYPFFKFSPELRYSRGITNVHKPFDSIYNNSIQRLSTNTITLYLNFE